MSVQQRQGLLAKLAKEFVRLPGIGQKTSQRLAFHMMKVNKDEALRLADAIRDVKEFVVFCEQCRNIAESELCDICQDPERDRTKILVVEEPSTLHAIDQSRGYKGLYHVLMGSLSPLDGVGPSDIRAKELEARSGTVACKRSSWLRIPPSEATAIYLTKLLKPYGVKVSRIAYGIPVGSARPGWWRARAYLLGAS